MEQLFTSFVGAPANALTLLIAAGLLFFHLVDKGYIKINIGKNGNGTTPVLKDKETDAGMRNMLQPLILKMDELLGSQGQLAVHFNHETTELLAEIRDGIIKLNQTHANYEIIGIKTRDCEK